MFIMSLISMKLSGPQRTNVIGSQRWKKAFLATKLSRTHWTIKKQMSSAGDAVRVLASSSNLWAISSAPMAKLTGKNLLKSPLTETLVCLHSMVYRGYSHTPPGSTAVYSGAQYFRNDSHPPTSLAMHLHWSHATMEFFCQ